MSVTAAKGFRAAGLASGIKHGGALDLALVAAARPVPAAAVFTTNLAPAAPVSLSRAHLAAGPTAQAVVLNSGCANAGTGAGGAAAAVAAAGAAAGALGCGSDEVLVCSTGTIGEPLPIESVVAGVGEAVAALAATPGAGSSAAEAIMTTDTSPKQAFAAVAGFTVGGMAKGAGMLRPDMATMLVVITTDAVADAPILDAALRAAVDQSFHALNIDGCASTNDTVIALASGDSGAAPDGDTLAHAMTGVCVGLAEQMAGDAEGASRVVQLEVRGAADAATARAMGRAIADWDLVRTSFYGGDPNWGRLLAALGTSGHEFDPGAVAVRYQGVTVAEGGVAVAYDEGALGMDGDLVVEVTVGVGPGQARVLTTDLTPEYVRFNGERS